MKITSITFAILFVTLMQNVANCQVGASEKRSGIASVKEGSKTYYFPSVDLDDGYYFLGYSDGNQKFLINRHNNSSADITVFLNDKLTYTMSDEAIELPSGRFAPGQTYKEYTFYLSPDKQFLFVVRGLVRSVGVAYLYKRSSSSQMQAVRPQGFRLDDAALRQYCHKDGRSIRLLARGARTVHFVEWDVKRHHLIFTMHAASYFAGGNPKKGDISGYWYNVYDLNTGKLKIIEHL